MSASDISLRVWMRGCSCGETFWSQRSLDRHRSYNCTADALGGWDLSLACHTCGEQFVSQGSLRRHYATQDRCGATTHSPRADDFKRKLVQVLSLVDVSRVC